MGKEKEPQSFALILAEADAGLLNKQISAAFADLSDDLDERSMLHEKEMKGEITIKLKVTNDRGKVLITPASITVKKPAVQYGGARFYRTETGELSTQDPRVVGDLFSERREAKARSAAAPTVAGKGG